MFRLHEKKVYDEYLVELKIIIFLFEKPGARDVILTLNKALKQSFTLFSQKYWKSPLSFVKQGSLKIK